MQSESINRYTASLSFIYVFFVFGIVIYASQPWTIPQEEQNIFEYLLILISIIWACSPGVILFCLSKLRNIKQTQIFVRFFETSLICIGGILWISKAIIIDPGAQSGIILILLPLGQLLLIGLIEFIGVALMALLKK